MKDLSRGRKAIVGGLVTLGALIGLVVFVVVPAVASTAGASTAQSTVPPGASPSGVVPVDQATGGQSNDCSFFYTNNATGKTQPAYQFRIANPKKGSFPYTDPATGVSFQVTVDSTDKFASFVTPAPPPTGGGTAKVVDVGIKGGTDETWYNYDQAAYVTQAQQPASFPLPSNDKGGYVTEDGGPVTTSPGTLHAPAQDTSTTPVTLYSVSNLTFCYNVGSVSGTVYLDANQDGTNGPADTPLAGWSVRLYGSGPTPVATTTSGADGSYRFNVGLSTYRICEAPPATSPGPWAQTEPLPSSTNRCSAAGELKKGYSFTASAVPDITGKNFGNVQGVSQPCPPPSPFGTDPNFQIQLAACKPGQTFVFSSTSAVVDGNANTPPPTFSVFAADETQRPFPDVERIIAPFTIKTPDELQNSGPQSAVTLVYDDVFPFSLADAAPMPFCKLDPRVTGSEFNLQPAYSTDGANTSGPGAHGVLPSGATSCVIQQTQSATRLGTDLGTYTAYVYSELDGFRAPTP